MDRLLSKSGASRIWLSLAAIGNPILIGKDSGLRDVLARIGNTACWSKKMGYALHFALGSTKHSERKAS